MTAITFISPLFVPANRPDRFARAAASGADALILDLEDAVADDAKDAARAALRADFTDLPVVVRINGAGTRWHEADLVAVRRLSPAAIMLPKAEIGPGLGTVLATGLPVLTLIETARGLSDARQIAALDGVARLIFGSIDYCADLQCAHTREALLAARSELALASRLAGVPGPVDGVTVSIDDRDAIEADARHACDLGFGGKLAIHPRQIDPIRQGFLPDMSDVEWARRVLASGDGAATVDGAMVDEPVRIRARAILARANIAVRRPE